MIGQIIRIHLWAERLIDGIILQVDENPKDMVKQTFAHKQKHLFKLGLIDKTHNQDLKILNKIRNLYSHESNPDEQVFEAIKKFPSYHYFKNQPKSIDKITRDGMEMGKFANITLVLLMYLMSVFWNPQK